MGLQLQEYDVQLEQNENMSWACTILFANIPVMDMRKGRKYESEEFELMF